MTLSSDHVMVCYVCIIHQIIQQAVVTTTMGRDSSVGIATRYGLEGPGIESRWEARFFAPVQTGPGAYPASCTMGTGSFPGVQRPGRGADHPPPSKCRSHERVGLYLYSPSGPQWSVVWRAFTFLTPCAQEHLFRTCQVQSVLVYGATARIGRRLPHFEVSRSRKTLTHAIELL